MQRFGLVGVGFMGKGMARNVIAKSAGQHKILLCDANLDALKRFVDELWMEHKLDCSRVLVTSDPSSLLNEVDLLAVSLPSEAACEQVLFHPRSGAVSNLASDAGSSKIIVEHSTLSRAYVMQCHARATERGVAYVDGPVSGGPHGALNGTLSVMLGGDSAPIDRLRSFLQMYAQTIMHMGPAGCGMAAKLVNQALVGIHAQAACEAIKIAYSMQLTDISKLRALLCNSWGQSKVLDLVMADFVEAAKESKHLPSICDRLARQATAAPLRNMDKDFQCILQSSSEMLPLVMTTAQSLSAACTPQAGLKDAPFAALLNLGREAGREIGRSESALLP